MDAKGMEEQLRDFCERNSPPFDEAAFLNELRRRTTSRGKRPSTFGKRNRLRGESTLASPSSWWRRSQWEVWRHKVDWREGAGSRRHRSDCCPCDCRPDRPDDGHVYCDCRGSGQVGGGVPHLGGSES